MITRSLPNAYASIRVRLVETLQTLTRKTSRATIPALLLLCSVRISFATNWTNTSLGDWFIDTNWDSGVPTAANSALIYNGGIAYITGAFANSDDLYVGTFFDSGTPGGNGTLLLSASSGNPGSLTATDMYVGYLRFGSPSPASTITGNVNIAGGSSVHTKGTTYYGYGVDIGDSSSDRNGGPAAGTVTVDGAGSLLDAQAGSIVMGV